MKEDSEFPIAIKARLKHGFLFEALEKRGWNQRQAAKFLGINPCLFGDLINMKTVPKNLSDNFVLKLYELTGRSPEELWPKHVFTPVFLAMPKTFKAIRKVPVHILSGYGIVHALPALPGEELFRSEAKAIIQETLNMLPPRETSP